MTDITAPVDIQKRIAALEALFDISLEGILDKINEIRKQKCEPTTIIVPGLSIVGIPLELRDDESEVRIRYVTQGGSGRDSLTLATPKERH